MRSSFSRPSDREPVNRTGSAERRAPRVKDAGRWYAEFLDPDSFSGLHRDGRLNGNGNSGEDPGTEGNHIPLRINAERNIRTLHRNTAMKLLHLCKPPLAVRVDVLRTYLAPLDFQNASVFLDEASGDLFDDLRVQVILRLAVIPDIRR